MKITDKLIRGVVEAGWKHHGAHGEECEDFSYGKYSLHLFIGKETTCITVWDNDPDCNEIIADILIGRSEETSYKTAALLLELVKINKKARKAIYGNG
jgi:hypothetical protein